MIALVSQEFIKDAGIGIKIVIYGPDPILIVSSIILNGAREMHEVILQGPEVHHSLYEEEIEAELSELIF